MSYIDELLQQYCPDGVEYKKLSDVLKIKNGSDYKTFSQGNIPVYGSGGIIYYIDKFAYNKPSVLIPRKGSINKLYYVDVPFWTVDTIFYTEINTKMVVPKFVYFYLQMQHLEKLNTAGGVPSLTQTVLNKIQFPVPPLEIQQQIVRILDNFTKLTTELTTELTARKKQYEYYRDNLLTFDDTIPKLQLQDIATISRGEIISKDYIRNNKGIYPVYSSQTENNGVLGKIATYKYDGEYLTWTTDGANAGSVFYRNGKFNITNVCGLLKVYNINVLPRYLYFILKITAPKYVAKGMGNPKLMSNVMAKITIPIPPLEKQERIVAILDRFDALCNDINAGLPAEIDARKKQYEYYRNKLLTFSPKKQC